MTDETQTQSIQARIAALNLGHVGRAPITANGGKPEAPFRPLLEERSQSSVSQFTLNDGTSTIGNEPNGPRKSGVLPPPSDIVRTGQMQAEQKIAKAKAPPPPRLPTRKQSGQGLSATPLPQRKSDQMSRKTSSESLSSTVSSISAISIGQLRSDHSRTASVDAPSRIKAPVYDPSTLPPLPPKRNSPDSKYRFQDAEKPKLRPSSGHVEIPTTKIKLTPSVKTVEVDPPPSAPSLPPRRFSRPEPALPPRKLPPQSERPPAKPPRPALSFGLNRAVSEHAASDSQERGDQESTVENHGAAFPPPIPLASRPDLSRIQGTKPKPSISMQDQSYTNGSSGTCLLCRDFSAPDSHAAKFPRQSVPSLDWLAGQLTAPFSDSPTDQARCIFTWLHHNIAYDTVSFFNNNVKPSTPASTLSTGLAVCEGYAGLFTALATKGGLESVVVGGHGKGYSFAPLKPGDPIPAEYSTHAWNAVKIDNGEWKLIDACWGAGHVNGKNQPYTKHFSPRMFTMSNDEFGLRHFPINRAQFFRSDDRQISWEEYISGSSSEGGGVSESVQIYSGVAEREGLRERSITPQHLRIPLSLGAGTTRFQFSRVCSHWSPVRNGQGADYVYILAIHGIDGREDDYIPFDTDGHGRWWANIETRRLGAAGQTISLYTVESVDGDSGRGLTVSGFREAKGRKGMGFGGVAAWELLR